MEKFLDLFGRMTLRPMHLLSLPLPLYHALGFFSFEWKRALFKRDQIRQLTLDESLSPDAPKLSHVPGMRPLAKLEDKAPEFLRSYRHPEDLGSQPLAANVKETNTDWAERYF